MLIVEIIFKLRIKIHSNLSQFIQHEYKYSEEQTLQIILWKKGPLKTIFYLYQYFRNFEISRCWLPGT